MHEASLLMIFRQIFLLIVAELCCQEKLLLDIYGYIYIRYQNFVSGIENAIFEMSHGVLVLHWFSHFISLVWHEVRKFLNLICNCFLFVCFAEVTDKLADCRSEQLRSGVKISPRTNQHQSLMMMMTIKLIICTLEIYNWTNQHQPNVTCRQLRSGVKISSRTNQHPSPSSGQTDKHLWIIIFLLLLSSFSQDQIKISQRTNQETNKWQTNFDNDDECTLYSWQLYIVEISPWPC